MNDLRALITHPVLSRMDGLPANAGRGEAPPAPTRFTRRKWPRETPRVAIAILSHNYGRYLTAAIESALAQSWPAREIVVVDVASTDGTAAVAASFAPQGVRAVRIAATHPNAAKRAALGATTAEALVFLDADDVLPPDYLEQGLPLLADHRVGIVYSDWQEFGDSEARVEAPEYAPGLIAQRNCIHSAAIVLRQALLIADALEPPDGPASHHDWHVWRRVLGAGFTGARSSAVLRYRRHAAQWSRHAAALPYYERAGLGHETVTIFVPLSGRAEAWQSHLRPWLDEQAWPAARVRLVLTDTSQDETFGATVRAWLAASSYAAHDARYYTQSVGARGLNARPRPDDGGVEVNLAMRRIYARMARELTTDLVVVVEDDHRPPDDAIERLLRGLDEDTAAVSGLYRGRTPGGEYVVWGGSDLRPADGPAIPVAGSGFGTLLLRRNWLDGETFTSRRGEPYPYDIGYCARVAKRGGGWKLARDVLSAHFGAPDFPPHGQEPPAPPPSESAALAITAKCPHARLCDCASRGMIECPPGGRRPGERVAPSTCRACPEYTSRTAPLTALTIRAPLASWTGYGVLAEQLGRALEARGVAVGYDPLGVHEEHGPLPAFVRDRIGRGGSRALAIGDPPSAAAAGEPAIPLFTTWETTRLDPVGVAALNARPVVFVPSTALQTWLVDSGVTAPIVVAGHGAPAVEAAPLPEGRTVFGTAGTGPRKGINEVIAAFVRAFPNNGQVELQVKCWPEDLGRLRVPDDPRIRVITDDFTPEQLANWYRGLSCYVTASRGEGWGLMTHEAMSHGRPVIACRWGGTAEYFDGSCGWEVEHDLEPARGRYDTGLWCVPRQSSLVEALRAARASRAALAAKGAAAAARAAEFTWDDVARIVAEEVVRCPLSVVGKEETETGAGASSPTDNREPTTDNRRRRRQGKVRAGIIAPGLWSGGAEQWMHSLARHVDRDRVEWAGTAIVYEKEQWGEMRAVIERQMPVRAGTAAVDRLYRECDVVLVWGITSIDQRIPPRPRGCRVVLVSHGCGHWTARVFERPELADALVGVSPSSIAPIPPEIRDRVRVLLNCHEPERVVPAADRDELRRQWGVRDGEHVVGYLGRISPEKNPEALLALVAARDEVRGVVVSGTPPDALRAKAEQLGVADRVAFHGYAPTAGHALPGFDWLLLPSHEEACAITLLEAWAAGVPTIATPVGVVTEHPELVRMVPINPTGQALSAALGRDLADPAAVAARVDAAREVAQTIYGPERFGREWTELIISLGGGHAA